MWCKHLTLKIDVKLWSKNIIWHIIHLSDWWCGLSYSLHAWVHQLMKVIFQFHQNVTKVYHHHNRIKSTTLVIRSVRIFWINDRESKVLNLFLVWFIITMFVPPLSISDSTSSLISSDNKFLCVKRCFGDLSKWLQCQREDESDTL